MALEALFFVGSLGAVLSGGTLFLRYHSRRQIATDPMADVCHFIEASWAAAPDLWKFGTYWASLKKGGVSVWVSEYGVHLAETEDVHERVKLSAAWSRRLWKAHQGRSAATSPTAANDALNRMRRSIIALDIGRGQ